MESNILWATSPATKNKCPATIKIKASVVDEHIKKNICESQVQKLPLQLFRKANVSCHLLFTLINAMYGCPFQQIPDLWTVLQHCNSFQLRKSHAWGYLKSEVSPITAAVTTTTTTTNTAIMTTTTVVIVVSIYLATTFFSKGEMEMQLGFIALPLSGNVPFQTSARKFISV